MMLPGFRSRCSTPTACTTSQRRRHLREVTPAPPRASMRLAICARRSPRGKVFHRDISVIVGDAEIEDAHHVRVANLRDQLVFLQEARELHVLVARLGRHRAALSARPSRRHARSRRDTPSTCRRWRARARSDGRESSPVRSATHCSRFRSGAQQRELLASLLRPPRAAHAQDVDDRSARARGNRCAPRLHDRAPPSAGSSPRARYTTGGKP